MGEFMESDLVALLLNAHHALAIKENNHANK